MYYRTQHGNIHWTNIHNRQHIDSVPPGVCGRHVCAWKADA